MSSIGDSSSKLFSTSAIRIYVVALGLIGSIIITRALGVEERGEYYYIISILGIAVQFATFGLQSSNTYYYHKDHESRHAVFGNTLAIVVLAGLVSALISTFFVFSKVQSVGIFVLLTFFVVAVPMRLFELFSHGLLVAREDFRSYNTNLAVMTTAQLVLVCIGWWYSASVTGFLMIPVAIIFLSCGHLFTKLPWELARPSLAFFFTSYKYALRAFVVSTLGYFYSRLGIFLVASYDSAYNLGIYSVTNQINETLLILPQTLGLVLFPKILQLDDVSKEEEVRKAIYFVLVLMGCVALVFGLFGEFLISSLFGQDYRYSAQLLIFNMPGIIALSMSTVISQKFAADGMPWSLTLFWGFSTLLYIAVYILLNSQLGLISASIGYSVSAIALFFSLLIKNRSTQR